LSLAIGALLIALPVNLFIHVEAPARVFLVGILISAISFGLWPSLFASLISAVIYDLFFLPPIYSLSIASRQDVLDLVCFLVIAIITSALAARVRRYAVAADRRAMSAEKLADFCCRLAEAATIETAIETAAERLFNQIGLPVCIIVPQAGAGCLSARFPVGSEPAASVSEEATRLWHSGESVAATIRGWRIMHLAPSDMPVGLLLLRLPSGEQMVTQHQQHLLDPLMLQIAMTIERFALQQRLLDVRLQKEAEALRATVLTSLSHDLRAPLASIIAGASGLDHQWQYIDDTTRIHAIRTVRAEAERLDGFIGKLLDMTRLENAAVIPQIERTFLGEVVCSAIDQSGAALGLHPIVLEIPDDLPLADADPVLLQQVLVNLFDNATKYSPDRAPIRVRAGHDEALVRLDIIDEGVGLRDIDLPFLFDRFYRVRSATGPVPGTGLGLAICQGFLQVMRGSIQAANRTDQSGAVFSIFLPLSIRETTQQGMLS
jgi:two-component system sensor histidine kinase KdpD